MVTLVFNTVVFPSKHVTKSNVEMFTEGVFTEQNYGNNPALFNMRRDKLVHTNRIVGHVVVNTLTAV